MQHSDVAGALLIAGGLTILTTIAFEYQVGWIGVARTREETINFVLSEWSTLKKIDLVVSNVGAWFSRFGLPYSTARSTAPSSSDLGRAQSTDADGDRSLHLGLPSAVMARHLRRIRRSERYLKRYVVRFAVCTHLVCMAAWLCSLHCLFSSVCVNLGLLDGFVAQRPWVQLPSVYS